MANEILTEDHGRVRLITLNRPEARNAVNGAVATRMEEILDDYEADPDLWVAILCGNGPVLSLIHISEPTRRS